MPQCHRETPVMGKNIKTISKGEVSMAGNTIEYMGEEAVRSWNDKTKAINSDIRENLQGVR